MLTRISKRYFSLKVREKAINVDQLEKGLTVFSINRP